MRKRELRPLRKIVGAKTKDILNARIEEMTSRGWVVVGVGEPRRVPVRALEVEFEVCFEFPVPEHVKAKYEGTSE